MPLPINERERRMAILQAALPYTTGSSHQAMELLLQANSFLETAHHKSTVELEACNMEDAPEEMLLHIQEYCTPKESDFIQTILNFMKADRLFRNYREFMQNNYAKTPSDLSAASINNNPMNLFFQLINGAGNPTGSSHLLEFLISQLSPEQQEIVKQFHTMQSSNS